VSDLVVIVCVTWSSTHPRGEIRKLVLSHLNPNKNAPQENQMRFFASPILTKTLNPCLAPFIPKTLFYGFINMIYQKLFC
jgi:hypothetical protein